MPMGDFSLSHSTAACECPILLDIHVVRRDKGAMTPTFLVYLVILCFERMCPTPNTVARLKSKIFGPSQNFGLVTLLPLDPYKTSNTKYFMSYSYIMCRIYSDGFEIPQSCE